MSKILKAEELEGEITPGFIANVVKIPPGLAEQDPLRERCDDRSIAVPKTSGAIWVDVRTANEKAFAATATFAADDLVRCDTVDVMPQYRRRGIATALYELASGVFEAPVVPSDNLSADAKLFWGDRTEIIYGASGRSERN